jgi:hypothetical protein
MPRFNTLTPEQLEELRLVAEGMDTIEAISDDVRIGRSWWRSCRRGRAMSDEPFSFEAQAKRL